MPSSACTDCSRCLLQCGAENDDLWNKAEEETELAKKEACNVKVQINKTTETAEQAASRKKEVGQLIALVHTRPSNSVVTSLVLSCQAMFKCSLKFGCVLTMLSVQANELADKAAQYDRKADEIRHAGDASRTAIPGDERAVETAKDRVREAQDALSPAK